MNQLLPCPVCRRHVRIAESVCPFCAAALHLQPVPTVVVTARMSRAALIALSATVAGTMIVGCSGSDVAVYGAPAPGDASVTDAADGGDAGQD
jgi:hypothetical protein